MSRLDFGVKYKLFFVEVILSIVPFMYFKRDLVLNKCLYTSSHLFIQIDVKEVLWNSTKS